MTTIYTYYTYSYNDNLYLAFFIFLIKLTSKVFLLIENVLHFFQFNTTLMADQNKIKIVLQNIIKLF